MSEGWSFAAAERPMRLREVYPHWKRLAAGSLGLHTFAFLLMFIVVTQPFFIGDPSETQRRPPVNAVSLPKPIAEAPPKADEVQVDAPERALPPPARRRDPERAAFQGADVLGPVSGIEPIDPRQIERFVQRERERESLARAGYGTHFSTCSLLPPERRLLEPACDGLLLARSPVPGVPATLRPPDAATLALIRRFEQEAPPDAPTSEGEAANDRSYRDPVEERLGKRPWE